MISVWGTLTGGPQCCISNLRNDLVNGHYAFNYHGDFIMVAYHMSNLKNDLCQVDNIFSHVNRLYVACRFKEMAMLSCRI